MNLLTVLLFAAAYWIGHHDGVEETRLYYNLTPNNRTETKNENNKL